MPLSNIIYRVKLTIRSKCVGVYPVELLHFLSWRLVYDHPGRCTAIRGRVLLGRFRMESILSALIGGAVTLAGWFGPSRAALT